VKLAHPPSHYYKRNWRSTFMVDRYAVMNRHVLGVGNIMVERLPAPRLRLAGNPARRRRHVPRRFGGRTAAIVR
jgi:hypothetical protein